MSKPIKTVLKEGTSILEKHNKSESKIDARLLLEHVLECDRVYLLLNGEKEISVNKYYKYINYIRKRASGIPLQYIIGTQQFMGIDFFVNEKVLIPRQETEELIELAFDIIQKSNIQKIMDIGTGSGCIPISICSKFKDILCIGIDKSKDALKIAIQNAKINNINNIEWINSDIFQNVNEKYLNSIDLIISNPPYIPTQEINELMEEVKDNEPLMALDGGEDGLYFYRIISQEAKKYLKDGGYIIYEVGHNQNDEVIEILKENKFKNISYKKDLSGIKRIVYATK